MLKHIFDEGRLLSGKARRQMATIDDALYFAFLNYLDSRETPQDNARAQIIGTYKLWRYSAEHEGEYALGRVSVFEDQNTRALCVSVILARNSSEGLRGTRDQFTGYLFDVSGMYLMIARDPRTDDLRMTLFPRFRIDEVGTDINERSVFAGRQSHIVHMDGFALGIEGGNGYCSPIHLSLVDDVDELANIDELLDVVPEGDQRVPRRVIEKLKRSGPLRLL